MLIIIHELIYHGTSRGYLFLFGKGKPQFTKLFIYLLMHLRQNFLRHLHRQGVMDSFIDVLILVEYRMLLFIQK